MMRSAVGRASRQASRPMPLRFGAQSRFARSAPGGTGNPLPVGGVDTRGARVTPNRASVTSLRGRCVSMVREFQPPVGGVDTRGARVTPIAQVRLLSAGGASVWFASSNRLRAEDCSPHPERSAGMATACPCRRARKATRYMILSRQIFVALGVMPLRR